MTSTFLEALADQYTGKVVVVGVTSEVRRAGIGDAVETVFVVRGKIGDRDVKHEVAVLGDVGLLIPEAARACAEKFRRMR